MTKPKLLHEIFARSATRYPERIAVRLAETDPEASRRSQLSYGELYTRASRFARYLKSKDVKPKDRVVLHLPRGLDAYMVLLGILEAGATYVPVDWSYPHERVSYIAQECTAHTIVTTAERAGHFRNSSPCVIAIDDELGDIAALDPLFLEVTQAETTPQDLAYIIYTSGSTGRPKGVMISHSNIVFQIAAESEILAITKDDIVYASASLAFDMSLEEMWGAFNVGATLLVGTETLAKAVYDLPKVLDAHKVTVWCTVPSLLAMIDHPLPHIRLLNVGGEACPLELVRRWALGRRMINTYGPTETTITATWAELSPEKPVTIGRPLPGYWTHVVNEDLEPVLQGEEGELLIGGPGVGRGYWNDACLTQKKFVAIAGLGLGPDGCFYRTGDLVRTDAQDELEFKGRIDLQVKIRGYRVELGEIESVLREERAVGQVAVNLYEDHNKSQLLVAFVTPRAGQDISIENLRKLAAQKLPDYMRPHAYVVQAELPVTVSGKLDRRALERPKGLVPEERHIEKPADGIEKALLDIWNEIFAPAAISVTDDFFEDLGGHSLRAAHMISRARQLPLFATLGIQDIYAAPTIRKLAERARANAKGAIAHATPFAPVKPSRYFFCVSAQAVAVLFIFALSGLQWAFPYLVYTVISTPDPATRLPALFAALATFVVVPPVITAFSIAFKWIIIGRFKPGTYPLWGSYYFRWWLVRRLLTIMPINFLGGTPLMNVYFKLLGAKIGANAFIRSSDIDAPDLVSIGKDAILGKGAALATCSVEHGVLRIGRCDIGASASIGAMTVVGYDTKIGEAAILEDMSFLPSGNQIAPHEIWTGSPAKKSGMRPRLTHQTQPGRLRRALVTLGLSIAAALLPLAAVLPIAPGLIGMMELDWASQDYSYIALSPILALTYVLGTCIFIVLVKKLLLGRVRTGLYSIWSWFFVRFWFTQQLGELALDLVRPLYATLYIKPWYRALGAKVGARAEISTATAVVHDLVEIGTESFIADGVVFGDDRAEPNRIRLERTKIGRRSFLGNSALIPAGGEVGDDVLIGVLSTPPLERAKAMESGSTWFGLPPLRIPHRQVVVQFDEGARFKPSRRLIGLRLAIEYVRITLPLTGFIALFCLLLTVVGDLSLLPHGTRLILELFPFLYLGFVIGAGLLVALVKWLVIGRYKPTTAPLWSLFVWRSELVTALYENLAVPLLLEHLRGTPFINIVLRLLGSKIGRRVFTDTTDMTEFDLITVGDDVALNEYAGLQTHLFEDRVMKVGRVRIGDRAVVGSRAIVLYDSVMEDDSYIGDLSVLMKGEVLPKGTAWEGSPAQPLHPAAKADQILIAA